jgi:DNA-binding response OmpR family regulator
VAADVVTRRILLVEDEPDLRHLARRVLRRDGWEVEVAADGVQAEEVMRQTGPDRFDAVLLDLVMPRRDGPETFAVLRELAPAVPVLIVSGYDASQRAAQLLREPATAYLTKPFGRRELAAALRTLLHGDDGAAP